MSDPTRVIDYDAWRRGYMPPSEHVLIDALAYRGARVVASSSVVRGAGWWIVMQGDAFGIEDTVDLMVFAAERQAARIRRQAARIEVEPITGLPFDEAALSSGDAR